MSGLETVAEQTPQLEALQSVTAAIMYPPRKTHQTHCHSKQEAGEPVS